jgi:tRNA-dihydrouridine synthase B
LLLRNLKKCAQSARLDFRENDLATFWVFFYIVGAMELNFKNSKYVIYAPMAGVSDSPTRKIAKSLGAQIVVSGLVSAEAIIRNSKRTLDLARFDNLERPIGLQIFGARPQAMAHAAQILAELQPDFIDINFGCPAPKVVGKNGGSSILKDLDLLEDIVSLVIKAVDIPVTVKMRAGWDSDSLSFLDAGKIIEDSGAVAVTLHPRTKMQAYGGQADWNLISELKKSLSIPVIGNGDIFSPQDAQRMLDETGCDAIMIGRASLGNPWLFKRVRHYLENDEILPEPTVDERLDMALQHFNMMLEYYGQPLGVYKMRSQFCWYLRGLPDSAEIKTQINRLLSPVDIKDLLFSYRYSLEKNISSFSSEFINQQTQ